MRRIIDIATAIMYILLALLLAGMFVYASEALTGWTLWYSRVTIHWKSVIASGLIYGVVFLLLITWPKENKYG